MLKTWTREEVKGMVVEALNADLTPVVHPNGFIQLKTTDGRRLHFWHQNIPRQKRSSPIHDHIFDMHSEIIAGTLIHEEIRVHEEIDGYYDIYEAVSRNGGSQTDLVSTGKRARVDRCWAIKMMAGDTYDFEAFKFHETRDMMGPCVSIISKGQSWDDFNPNVLIKHGTEPDNEFERESFPIAASLSMIDTILDKLM